MTRRRAFTLVELLVVIGIIALLIGILLPTLSKAREAGQRTVCLSSLRELGTAYRIYAAQYKDQIPIGYMDQHQFSYFVNWRNSNGTKVSMMGLLAVVKLTPNPKVFYCPTLIDDPRWGYNTAQNRWPNFQDWPNDPLFNPPLPSGPAHLQITYNQRPVACWPSSSKPTNNVNDWRYWTPYLSVDWTEPGGANEKKEKYGFPKFSKLKNAAIISDLIISRHFIIRTHKKGVNVLYANGSGQWIPLSVLEEEPGWAAIPDGQIDTGQNDIFLREQKYSANGRPLPGPQNAAGGVWTRLDRASK